MLFAAIACNRPEQHTGDHSHDHELYDDHVHVTTEGTEHESEIDHEHLVNSDTEHDAELINNKDQKLGDLINFHSEEIPVGNFKVERISPTPFSGVIRASGQIVAVPGEKKHLPAHTNGILLFANKHLVQGSQVSKGEKLFTISASALDPENFQLKYNELKNNYENSRSKYFRYKGLFEQRVVSERQYLASRNEYLNDSLRFYELAGATSATGMQITSPISGYIHELNFAEGQYVETGDQIVTISTNEQLLLRADVPMQYFAMVPDIVNANFRTAYSAKVYDVMELNGKLLSKGSSVAENDHFIPVYFQVENDGSLLEGAYAEIYLKTHEENNAIAVPVTALSEEQGVFYCYLQLEEEIFSRVPVKKGISNGRFVQIESGLNAGDRIVTRGVSLIRAASMVTVDNGHSGHSH